MGYDPQFYEPLYGDNPYRHMRPQMQPRRTMPQIIGDQLIKVTGEAGVDALATNMGANSRAAAFDANDDIFYVITTDGAAYPTKERFRFYKDEPEPQQQGSYATQADLIALQGELNKFREDMKGAMQYVQQLIQGTEPRNAAVPAKTASADTEL